MDDAWPSCRVCGKPSLAQITNHSCPDCEDDYQYCLGCAIRVEREAEQ